jgi:hypothetical protein
MKIRNVVAGALVVAVLAAACGGGGGDKSASSSDEEQAGATARQAVISLLGLFTGATSGKDMLGLFAPECRQGVKTSDIDAALVLIRAFVPTLPKDKIEDVDLGDVSYNRTSEGIEVTPGDPNAIKIKVKGKWVAIDDYFNAAGFSSSEASTTADEPLLMVKRDGKWYIGDCSSLQDMSSPFGSLSDSTPTTSSGDPRSGGTATAVSNSPGGSRTNAVKLGQSGRVENTWELTVLSVNRDAWPVVQKESTFNDPPAANEKMLLITLRAKNIATKQNPENIDTFSLSLVGSRNQLYDSYSSRTNCGLIPNELDADLYPNGQAEGNVCFKVPSDETGFVLVWQGFLSSDLTYFALE